MYCNNCGSKIKEGDKYCPNCGNEIEVDSIFTNYEEGYTLDSEKSSSSTQTPPVDQENKKSDDKQARVLSILAIIFGAFGGWLGLVFGIIGLIKNKEGDLLNKILCILSIIIFFFWFILGLIYQPTLSVSMSF